MLMEVMVVEMFAFAFFENMPSDWMIMEFFVQTEDLAMILQTKDKRFWFSLVFWQDFKDACRLKVRTRVLCLLEYCYVAV